MNKTVGYPWVGRRKGKWKPEKAHRKIDPNPDYLYEAPSRRHGLRRRRKNLHPISCRPFRHPEARAHLELRPHRQKRINNRPMEKLPVNGLPSAWNWARPAGAESIPGLHQDIEIVLSRMVSQGGVAK